MNNIETKDLDGLEPGMTEKEILDIKNGKVKKQVKLNIPVQNEFQFKLNLIKDNKDDRDFLLSSTSIPVSENLFTIPKIVNYREEMSPVKDQGRKGSCVGFAATAMKEWQEQKEHNEEIKSGKSYKRKQKYYDLSEQWIYHKCKEIDPWPNTEGTSLRCAMKVLNKIGVPTEKAWPYSDIEVGEPKRWANLISKWGLIESYYRCENLNDIKVSLSTNGPLIIGILCFEEIMRVGNDGIVPYPSNPNICYGGHAVCCVGYNDNNNTLIFKNSWSENWGNKGYGFISYKYAIDFVIDAWAANDLKVTRKILNERAKDEL